MPFNLIALLIILISGGIVVYISIRKFPELANLNTDDLPEDALAKKKQRILEERFVRSLRGAGHALAKASGPLASVWSAAQERFRQQVGKSKQFLLKEERAKRKTVRPAQKKAHEAPAEKSDRIERLLASAEGYLESKQFTDAENTFLEVIKLDEHQPSAYRGLGKVYMKTGQYDMAQKTFEFLSRLTPADDTVFVKLGKNAELAGDIAGAIRYYERALAMNDHVALRHFEISQLYRQKEEVKKAFAHAQQAVELESTNPRYLDGLLEISIMKRDKKAARDAYQRLRLVNPENMKLAEFKQRMDELG